MPVLGAFGAAAARGFGLTSGGAFLLTISSNQTNANLRTLAVAAGWNQNSPVLATINSGIFVSSTSTGTPALTINGSFPGGVTLVNSGTIQGMGGSAGRGGDSAGTQPNVDGRAGNSGGLALSVSVPVRINNLNRIAGGGGGGGGGGGATAAGGKSSPTYSGGGGGGGGGLGGSGGAGGAGGPGLSGNYVNGVAGGSGTQTTNGSGGSGGSPGGGVAGGAGGAGGSYGSSGSNGVTGTGATQQGTGGGGGAAGAAVTGNSNITWIATGTRNGGIS